MKVGERKSLIHPFLRHFKSLKIQFSIQINAPALSIPQSNIEGNILMLRICQPWAQIGNLAIGIQIANAVKHESQEILEFRVCPKVIQKIINLPFECVSGSRTSVWQFRSIAINVILTKSPESREPHWSRTQSWS